jgi:hypothetical protein
MCRGKTTFYTCTYITVKIKIFKSGGIAQQWAERSGSNKSPLKFKNVLIY